MRHLFPLAACIVILAGCATTDTETEGPVLPAEFADDPRLGEEVKRLCFASSIDSFGQTTRDTVVVREGRDHYLIEVYGGCHTMDFAQAIGVRSHGSCLTPGDKLIVSDTFAPARAGSSLDVGRCYVKNIYKWDPDATEADSETEAETKEMDPETTDDDAGATSVTTDDGNVI